MRHRDLAKKISTFGIPLSEAQLDLLSRAHAGQYMTRDPHINYVHDFLCDGDILAYDREMYEEEIIAWTESGGMFLEDEEDAPPPSSNDLVAVGHDIIERASSLVNKLTEISEELKKHAILISGSNIGHLVSEREDPDNGVLMSRVEAAFECLASAEGSVQDDVRTLKLKLANWVANRSRLDGNQQK